MDARIFLISSAVLFYGCSNSHLRTVSQERTGVLLSVSEESSVPELSTSVRSRDTAQVINVGGRRMMVVNAEKDANGEMVAADVLQEVTVVARFRNIAERNGVVQLKFMISVPEALLDSKWQLRFFPKVVLNDRQALLDSVCITGGAYRQSQLKGYQRYEKLLASISADSSRFVDRRKLEIFLKRNIPQIYNLKNDTTDVSDEQFTSIYDIGRREVLLHYTNRLLVRFNARKVASKDKMLSRWVPNPITLEGIKLDTVIAMPSGAFNYEYEEVVRAGTGLRKAVVTLEGAVYEKGKKIYDIPRCEPVTYYISSLSAFAEDVPDMDSVYYKGVQAIRDREYKTAVTLLRPYRDFNSALAFCAMGYNATAYDVLEGLEETPKVLYLKALLLARKGEGERAYSLYLKACGMDRSLIHRGNLDPEIAALKNGMEVFEDE